MGKLPTGAGQPTGPPTDPPRGRGGRERIGSAVRQDENIRQGRQAPSDAVPWAKQAPSIIGHHVAVSDGLTD